MLIGIPSFDWGKFRMQSNSEATAAPKLKLGHHAACRRTPTEAIVNTSEPPSHKMPTIRIPIIPVESRPASNVP
jgi:hypothetical protein